MEKYWSLFSQILLKEHCKREIQTINEHSQGIFLQNQGNFFKIIKKGQGDLSLLVTLLSR